MELESIKDKIRKLLALSEDSTHDGETTAALMKAQKLMAQYKLEQVDIDDNQEKQECIHHKTILGYGSRSSDHYLNELATIIAENFCCVNYLSTPRGTRTHYISFIGMKEDVEIATEVLYVANRNIVKGYNKVYKDMCEQHGVSYMPAKYFNPRKCGYIEGYLNGLKKALKAQKEQNQEWGLVLVTPQEAQDYVGGLDYIQGHEIMVENTYYEDGVDDGKNFSLDKKLDTKGNQDKLAE